MICHHSLPHLGHSKTQHTVYRRTLHLNTLMHRSCESRKSVGVTNSKDGSVIKVSWQWASMHSTRTLRPKQPNRIQPPFILLLWHVKLSSRKEAIWWPLKDKTESELPRCLAHSNTGRITTLGDAIPVRLTTVRLGCGRSSGPTEGAVLQASPEKRSVCGGFLFPDLGALSTSAPQAERRQRG